MHYMSLQRERERYRREKQKDFKAEISFADRIGNFTNFEKSNSALCIELFFYCNTTNNNNNKNKKRIHGKWTKTKQAR